MRSPTLAFSKTYLYKLRLVTSGLEGVLDQILRSKADVTLSQFSLLATISEYGAINQRQVAQFLGVSPAAVKRQTSLAMQQGLLTMAPSPSMLGQALRLTPKGRATIERGLGALNATLSEIFSESDRQTDLMTHIDLLLSSTRGVETSSVREKAKPIIMNEKGSDMSVQIPKARKLYRGDINAAVIAVQRITGFEINPQWWDRNVGNNGTSEEILDRFDKAYERDFGAKIAAKQTS